MENETSSGNNSRLPEEIYELLSAETQELTQFADGVKDIASRPTVTLSSLAAYGSSGGAAASKL